MSVSAYTMWMSLRIPKEFPVPPVEVPRKHFETPAPPGVSPAQSLGMNRSFLPPSHQQSTKKPDNSDMFREFKNLLLDDRPGYEQEYNLDELLTPSKSGSSSGSGSGSGSFSTKTRQKLAFATAEDQRINNNGSGMFSPRYWDVAASHTFAHLTVVFLTPREVLEWPHSAGGGGCPPLQSDHRGKNEICHWENLTGPFVVHDFLPPPFSPLI